jgi:hypothetical protein
LDIWKATWLVYEKVIKEKSVPLPEDRKLLQDTLLEIKKDFAFLQGLPDSEKRVYDFTTSDDTSYSLQEDLSEFELHGDPMNVHPSLRADRWFNFRSRSHYTTGMQERVLFRTFVRATIAGENCPEDNYNDQWYMLALWVTEGEGEPQIALCNHNSSMNLTQRCERPVIDIRKTKFNMQFCSYRRRLVSPYQHRQEFIMEVHRIPGISGKNRVSSLQ